MISIIRFSSKAKLSRVLVEVQKFDWVLLEKMSHMRMLLFLASKLVVLSEGLGLDILPRKGAHEQMQEHIGK